MSKPKKGKLPKDDVASKLATFNLPEEITESSISCPSVILSNAKFADWNAIVEERDNLLAEIEEYDRSKRPPEVKSIFLETETEYLKKQILPILIPSLIQTLHKANKWQSLQRQKHIFNGLDYLAEQLWNRSPNRSEDEPYVTLFNMDWVRQSLAEKPRRYYPKSWLWPEEYAAIVIQRNVRKFLVQKMPEVNEMRNFWKKIQFEEANPSIMSNPMFAKVFATDWDFTSPKPNIAFKHDPSETIQRNSPSVKSYLNLFND